MTKDRYGRRGVSTEKKDVLSAIQSHDAGLYPGAFCKILPDYLTGDQEYCIVMHADGAGTKSALAYLEWTINQNNLNVWRGIIQDSLEMNFEDMACVGALGPLIVSTTIGRNKFLIPGEIIATIINEAKKFCEKLTDLGIPCYIAGGETADLGDLIRTIVVDNTVVCRMRRDQVIDASKIVPDDIIIGFSSTGKANWEDEPNSGIGSNGLTSARHDLLLSLYKKWKSTYSPEMPKKLVYCGKNSLIDQLPGSRNFTVGSALLSPTRTYLPLVKILTETIPHNQIHGLIHCSGGGQTKIMNFGKSANAYVKDNLFPVPPLFKFIQAQSGTPWREMYRVFNMGHRLEIVVPKKWKNACLKAAQKCGIEARVVGKVQQREEEGYKLTIKTPHGTFTY